MGLIKQLIPISRKFTPASAEVDWTRVETLVHGPAASLRSGDDHNSALFACLMAIATAYPEPPPTLYQRDAKGTSKTVPGHPMQDLIDNPTPAGELSPEELRFWTAWAKHIDGNAYWLKVRSGDSETGNVIETWPISPSVMEPASENGEWISYYKWRRSANEVVRVSPANVVHFRLGLDDRDMRRGLAPLKALIRQISTDDEATSFVDSLLKNYAIPGLVVIPAAGSVILQENAEEISNTLRSKFGNDKRGNIAVMSKESTIQQFGFSPEELDMSILHRVPEERISAVLGVPAIVAGLGAGLDRATYSNGREMAEWFTERKLIPQWRADAAKLNTSLLPDFESDPSYYIEYDLTKVRALQEDEDAKYTRLSVAVGKPFMTRNEARTDVGLDPVPSWDEEDVAPLKPPALPAGSAQDEQQSADEQSPKGDYEAAIMLLTREVKRATDKLNGSH